MKFTQNLLQELFARNYQGCDISPVNLFLYSQKYNTKICIKDNCLFRKYNENNSIYYGYPIFLTEQIKTEDLEKALLFIKEDAKDENSQPKLFFATDENLIHLERIKNINFKITSTRDLADYLYLQKKLSELPGSKYQKKRNHINQFIKKHNDAYFKNLTVDLLSDAMKVENQWLTQIKESTGENISEDLFIEKQLIETALNNFQELGLTGGIVYCENQPVAMCLASKINNKTTDIHFEKAIAPFAKDGAYAFINLKFAQTIDTEYINREEDLGFENLRKAKESYYPDLLLEKSIIQY